MMVNRREEKHYEEKTSRSRALFQRAGRLIPGGVCHAIRYFHPYPFFAERASGPRIWDVDGNEYVDFWMGHGALILGHNPPNVVEALREQLGFGCQWGTVNELELDLAEMVVRLVPSAEMVRFCNTGAEATMYACRLARGYTGREKIAKMEGGWHGFNSDLLYYVHGPFEAPESLGLVPARDKIVPLPFNDTEETLARLQEYKDELAAVMVEPVLGSGGFLPADRQYLQALRDMCSEIGAVLIFDEIITGFRIAPGGGQEYYSIKPDLTCLGKILGGGLPIGAVAGASEILKLSNTTGQPKGSRVAIGGGTFSCNPLSMRAGLETLTYLDSHRSIYEKISVLGKKIREVVENSLEVPGRTTRCTGTGSLFRAHFLKDPAAQLRSARDVHTNADIVAREEVRLALINRGIFTVEGGGMVSSSHGRDELKLLQEACEDVSETSVGS